MTYKYKLAKRLALAHGSGMLTLLITMAACQPGGALKEGLAPPDHAATLDTVLTAPETVTLRTGASQQFVAFGRTAAGDSVAVVVRQWTASGGTVNARGLFQADSIPGSFQVSASAELVDGNPGQQQGRSTIHISQTLPQLTRITVARSTSPREREGSRMQACRLVRTRRPRQQCDRCWGRSCADNRRRRRGPFEEYLQR